MRRGGDRQAAPIPSRAYVLCASLLLSAGFESPEGTASLPTRRRRTTQRRDASHQWRVRLAERPNRNVRPAAALRLSAQAATLAGRAVRRAASGDACLLDRRAAALARLAAAAVDLEVLLHRTGAAVGLAVVTQCRTLALDSGIEGALDSFAQGTHLLGVELARGPQRMDARAPERLVDIDVSEAG